MTGLRRTPSFMRTSIAEAFLLASSTDTNTGLSDQVTLGPTGYGGTISAQLYSLEICRDLVWNLELALSAGDDSLAIMIGIEAARVTSPFLRMQHPPEFAIAFLSACVLTIVDCLERVSAPLRVHILDVTSEMVFTFCKHIQLRDDKQALSVLLRVLPEQLMTHYPEGDVKILNNIGMDLVEKY